MIPVLYNLVLLAVIALPLRLFWRKCTFGTLLLSVSILLPAGVLSAILFYRNVFGVMALLSFAVFLHLPLVLALGSGLLRKRKSVSIVLALLSLGITGVGVDAFFVEPHWLEVNRLQLTSPLVSEAVRIVVLSDIQTDDVGQYERDVFQIAANQKPDLVLLTGDFIQERDARKRHAQLQKLRDAFRATGLDQVRMLAVAGNIDKGDWPRIFEGFPQTSIVTSTTMLTIGEFEIVGLSVKDSFNARLRIAPQKKFQIVVGHGPDFALSKDLSAQLLVAGHTHGGQVRLPFIGPLITLSKIPRSWAAGSTQLSEDKWLVVSRGIGMERDLAPRLRFLCRPEIVVIEIRAA